MGVFFLHKFYFKDIFIWKAEWCTHIHTTHTHRARGGEGGKKKRGRGKIVKERGRGERRERERDRERDFLSSGTLSQGWARVNSGARNSTQISHTHARNSSNLVITWCVPAPYHTAALEREQPGLELALRHVLWVSQAQLTPLYHNTRPYINVRISNMVASV